MLGLGNSIITGGTVTQSDFEPSDLGSTMLIWYKNDTGQTNLSGTDGTSANRMQWADQSGGSRHAYQDTTDDKPGDGLIYEGGMDFELDTQDHMNIAAGDGAIDFDHPKPFTIMVAMKRETHSAANQIIGSVNTEFLGFSATDESVKLRAGGSATVITFATSNLWSAGANFIITVTKDSSGNILCYKNSDFQAEDGGGTSTLTGTALDLTILGAQTTGDSGAKNFDGIIHEVIICDTVLSTTNRNLAIDYLKTKFSI